MNHDTTYTGSRGVTPSLSISPCSDAIDWYVEAFSAIELGERLLSPDGMVAHAEIAIEGARIMLGDPWPDGPVQSPSALGGTTMALFIQTDDVDALWERAIAAGAEVVYPLELQFYGDKGGRVRDPFGHTWGLSEHVEDVSWDEMKRRMSGMGGADDAGDDT